MVRMPRLLLLLPLLMATACASPPAADPPVDLVLLGEQHDQPDHQRRHRETVERLAAAGRLAALAMEMAERGTSTAGLPVDASEAAVRQALRWDDKGWPWDAYGPVVMAAVRAGVPVLGANLPRAQMRAAMADASLDGLLPPAAFARQREAIRDGHCGLMPESQLTPMARIQVARDRSMAQVMAQAARPGRTVVLVAGGGHVEPEVGVPVHLPASLSARPVLWPRPAVPARDYCAELRQRMAPTS